LEFNVPFQHKYGYIRDDVFMGKGVAIVKYRESLLWTVRKRLH